MAVAAEAIKHQHAGPAYEYAYSSQTVERWYTAASRLGPRAVGAAVTLETAVGPEADTLKGMAFADFRSSVREMLPTDAELGRYLYSDEEDISFPVINSQVCAPDGRPITDMNRTGAETSAELARSNAAYRGLADRDAADVEIAERNDQLAVGETHTVVMWSPDDDLRANAKLYGNLGYRRGVVWIHSFSRVSEDELQASYHSVEVKNEAAFLEVLHEHGFDIPPGADYNLRSQHGRVTNATREETNAGIRALRESYHEAVGEAGRHKSASEFLNRNDAVIRGVFDTYYPHFSKALATNTNNDVMRNFARSVLEARIGNLNSEVRQALLKAANSDRFDKSNFKVINSLLCYAVVEELRKGLSRFSRTAVHAVAYSPAQAGDRHWAEQANYSSTVPADITYLMVQNIAGGLLARRSYGGCAGVELGQDGLSSNIAGGGDAASVTYSMNGGRWTRRVKGVWGEELEDEYGSLTFTCPKNGCYNRRERGKLLKNCKKCGADVQCG